MPPAGFEPATVRLEVAPFTGQTLQILAPDRNSVQLSPGQNCSVRDTVGDTVGGTSVGSKPIPSVPIPPAIRGRRATPSRTQPPTPRHSRGRGMTGTRSV